MNLYFLGGGNMAQAIIANLLKNEAFNIVVADKDEKKREELFNQFNVKVIDAIPNLHKDDVLVLAVKPQDLQKACLCLNIDDSLVISIAAGISCASIERWINRTKRIVRFMPNLAAKIGEAITGIYSNFDLGGSEKLVIEQIATSIGSYLYVDDEVLLDKITSISGIGPGCIYYMMNSMERSALKLGFNKEEAKDIVLKTFLGAVNLASNTSSSFSKLQDQVTSKGGTTLAAIDIYRKYKLEDIINEAIEASLNRSLEISKEYGG